MSAATRNETEVTGIRRFLTRAGLRAALPYVVLGLLLVLALLLVGRELDRHLQAIESWIGRLGPWGVLAFLTFFVVASSLLVPDSVLCIVAGALFGIVGGTLVVVAGNVIAAALQWSLSHRLLRGRIARSLAGRPSLAAIQRAVARDEIHLQVLLRLTPLNPATLNYLLGAAGARLGGFLLAGLAHTPHLLVEVYFGHAGKHVARMAASGERVDSVRDYAVLAGAVVGVLVLFLVSRLARQAVVQAVAESASEGAVPGPPAA